MIRLVLQAQDDALKDSINGAGKVCAAACGVTVMAKTLVVDLSPFNLPAKIEGISLVRPDVLVVSNDNDFGMIDAATFDSRGRMTSDTIVKSKLFYVQLTAPVR